MSRGVRPVCEQGEKQGEDEKESVKNLHLVFAEEIRPSLEQQ
jgi:hypothetical protein